MGTTRHYTDRADRLNYIRQYIGIGKDYKTVQIDRGHANGAELHTVTDNGIIFVRNARTHKLVTVLIARPQQIKRLGISDPWLLDIARRHAEQRYNEI